MFKTGRRKEREPCSSTSSTESSPTAKALKMADQESEHVETPSMADLFKTVKAIQFNTTVIMEDNKRLQKCYDDLILSISYHSKTVDEVKSKNETLTTEVVALKEQLVETKEEIKIMNEHIEHFRPKFDHLEQYSRKHNLVVHGIPEGDEDNFDLIVSLGELLGVDNESDDIDICHRLHSKDQVKPIIVKFYSHQLKTELYRSRYKLKEFSGNGTELNGATRIFINENLTAARARLFFEVRKRTKLYSWYSCYTSDGRIFVKTQKGGKQALVSKEADMEELYSEE